MKPFFRYSLIAVFLGFLGFGLFAWFDRTKVENVLLNAYIEKMRPSLPFQIVSYHLNRNLDSFEIHLIWKEIPISFLGPLQVKVLGKEGLSLEYRPILQIGEASPLQLKLTSEVSTRLQGVDGLHLEVPSQDFVWKRYGLDLKSLILHLELDKNVLETSVEAKALAWADAQHSDHAVNLTQSKINLNLLDVHKPTQGNLLFQAEGAEALWGKFYADLKLGPYPLQIVSTNPQHITLSAGKKHDFAANLLPIWDGQSIQSATGDFSSRSIALSQFLPWVIKMLSPVVPSFQAWTDLEVKSGQGKVSGKFAYGSTSRKNSPGFSLDELKLNLSQADMRSVFHHFSAHDFSASTQYRRKDTRHHAFFQAPQIFYKHFEGSLGKTELSWTDRNFKIEGPLPLQMKGIPAKLSAVEGVLKPEFDLTSQLKFESTDLQVLANGLCLPAKKFPPATLKLDFPTLELSANRIDPTGNLEVDLFKGKIRVEQIGYYDLDTEVPELDFDATWDGIDLQAMSDWSKFGEIQGTLEGYAHQVVFQSSLPTHYHFLLQVMPLDRVHDSARVDFSPEAMKNVVKIFTGTSLDEQMPGIAGWLMFGWPSHVFGGYDVNYAGIKLTSEEGRIVVETLDKPSIFARERKHYVIFGPRFKMPLQNPNYPLLIDATSMSNFVHQLMLQLNSIKKKKEGNKDDEDAPIICDPPEL